VVRHVHGTVQDHCIRPQALSLFITAQRPAGQQPYRPQCRAVPTHWSTRYARNVLLPGWILALGCVFLLSPPLGVAASLALFLVGVVLVPALILYVLEGKTL